MNTIHLRGLNRKATTDGSYNTDLPKSGHALIETQAVMSVFLVVYFSMSIDVSNKENSQVNLHCMYYVLELKIVDQCDVYV